MKTRPATHRNRGMTLFEAILVLATFVLLAAMILPAFSRAHRNGGPNCVSQLHAIGLAFKTWEGDNGNKFPTRIYATNIFGLKLMNSGNAYLMWQMMSNELSTPKYLRCPADTERVAATNFTTGFSDANISYFFGLDAADTYPQMILSGDDNLVINGIRVKPGILSLPTADSLSWTMKRHRGCGNIGMADGSVQQHTPATLNAAMIATTNGTAFSTYRWVIP